MAFDFRAANAGMQTASPFLQMFMQNQMQKDKEKRDLEQFEKKQGILHKFKTEKPGGRSQTTQIGSIASELNKHLGDFVTAPEIERASTEIQSAAPELQPELYRKFFNENVRPKLIDAEKKNTKWWRIDNDEKATKRADEKMSELFGAFGVPVVAPQAQVAPAPQQVGNQPTQDATLQKPVDEVKAIFKKTKPTPENAQTVVQAIMKQFKVSPEVATQIFMSAVDNPKEFEFVSLF